MRTIEAMIRAQQPVLILQHLTRDDPAYLGTWLERAGVAHDIRNTEAGDSFPATLEGYRALAILGGSMGANDDLPSLRQAEALVRQGVACGIPVIGHCLGGQLMARALGAEVCGSPEAEIGWQPLLWRESAAEWFGPRPPDVVMQWHVDAFSLPAGAVALATSDACPVQAFALGPHLAMQFHLEIDAVKAERWLHDPREAEGRTVQDVAALRAGTGRHLAAQQALADHVYSRWLSGCPA